MSEANRLRILYFLVFCCTASFLPLFADYLIDRGLSSLQVGIVLGITPLLMFLVQPFYGRFIDRIGYRRSLIWSSLLAALSFSLFLVKAGFIYIVLVTALMSVFYNTVQPILDSLSLQLADSNPKFSYGKLRFAGAAGWAFTGIITGQLIDAIDTTIIFAVCSISMLCCCFFAFYLPKMEIRPALSVENSYARLGKILQNKTLLILLFSVFLIAAGTSTIWYFYSVYMKQNGASASLVGMGLSFQGLCEIPLFYFSAKIIIRYGRKNTLLLTIFASVLRLILYGVVKNPYFALLIELLHGFSWSLFWVVCVEYVNELVDKEWRATGQSLLFAAYYGVGIIAGNFWTTWLSSAALSIADIYLLNAAIIFIVGIFVWIFLRKPSMFQTSG